MQGRSFTARLILGAGAALGRLARASITAKGAKAGDYFYQLRVRLQAARPAVPPENDLLAAAALAGINGGVAGGGGGGEGVGAAAASADE